MTLLHFIRLIHGNLRLLLIAPTLAASVVWLLNTGQPKEYRSETTIYTGLVSGYTIESEQGRRPDHLQISTGFDNLINTIRSKETLTEVSVKLIMLQLSDDVDFGPAFQEALSPVAQDGMFVREVDG